jgi:hypothetical protein
LENGRLVGAGTHDATVTATRTGPDTEFIIEFSKNGTSGAIVLGLADDTIFGEIEREIVLEIFIYDCLAFGRLPHGSIAEIEKVCGLSREAITTQLTSPNTKLFVLLCSTGDKELVAFVNKVLVHFDGKAVFSGFPPSRE